MSVPTGLTDGPAAALSELAAEIRARHRAVLRELRIEVVAGGVVLYGRARTFYGRQVALHEVRRRCPLTVVADHITVG
jgi:hypothetical protein